jgi:predicted ATPase
MPKISQFQVMSLYGYRTIDIKFNDNTIILVGENGAGKTTILRLLFYFLSGQWNALAQFDFKKLSITIDENTYEIKHSQIKQFSTSIDIKFLKRLPPSSRHLFKFALEQSRGDSVHPDLSRLCNRYGIPLSLALNELIENKNVSKEGKELERTLKDLHKIVDSQILYLPTYRRIEQELEFIFDKYEDDVHRNSKNYLRHKNDSYTYVELIEFGMGDVDSAIKNTEAYLKEFARESLNKLTLGYLGDVVEKQYAEVDLQQIKNAHEQTITNVLDRIQENILSKQNKRHLSDVIRNVKEGEAPSEHAKVICHYFLKLLNFQEELERREAQIQKFCTVCNNYMQPEKSLRYDSSSFKFNILKSNSRDNSNVDLKNLSSGEKQIVSLFSHLYLSEKKRFFILIDEPELSLSVPWQTRFLSDIKNSQLCSGLVAVTHSPFIYDNELRIYARSLGEFITEG